MLDQALIFLLRAKKSTYAAHGVESTPSRPNSHDLRYDEDSFTYIDTYLGGKRFAGEEALWIDGSPVWSMNYCGRVLDSRFDGDFLKRALLHVPLERPFRGPAVYAEGRTHYLCQVDGSIDWFQGYEEILLDDERVYECYFHGGAIE
ncbi:MAG: DUF5680 domain-containing protein [Eubacteriales bacterium]|jgi:hypothetical protein|nr:DUF5680 domain-containing protein [Eubacteriales bacterium]